MKFIFKVKSVGTPDVVDIKVSIQDPATLAVSEFSGELTMFRTQWNLLKSILIDGTHRYLDGEIKTIFEEFN